MLAAFARLIGLVLTGYLLFKSENIRRKFLPVASILTLNFLFPAYYVTRYGMTWDAAFSKGAWWMPIFFVMCVFTLLVQYMLIRWLLKYTRIFSALADDHKTEFMLLFAVHNLGYVPLPIFEAIAPPELLIYLFTYIMAYQLIFWSLAVNVIKHKPGEPFQMNFRFSVPFYGILAGILLASTGWYDLIPRVIAVPVEKYSRFAMDAIMIILGGILAGVPRGNIRDHKEFLPFLLYRQVLYPLAVLVVFIILRLLFNGPALFPGTGIDISETWRWLQLFLVIEAAVPPATNIMVAIQNYGRSEQLAYSGNGIIISYLGAAVSLPVFVILAYYL